MEIPKLKFTKLWTNHDDFPTVETREEVVRGDMQLLFNEIRDYINTTLSGVVSTIGDTLTALQGKAGAGRIGFTRTAAVDRDNVQDAIECVQSQLVNVSQGGIADGAVTAAKIADGAVTSEKIQSGAIQKNHFTSGALQEDIPVDELTFSATSTACTLSTHWCKFAVALKAVFFGAQFSNLSDADVDRKRVYITASGTGGYAFTTYGCYSAYVTYKSAGTTKYVSAPVFTTLLASHERALCVVLPDDVTKDTAGISVHGLYFVS